MAPKKAGLFPFKRLIAGIMAVVFFGTTVSESWAEASFWSDRRKAREKFSRSPLSGESSPLLLASANSLGSALGNARPVQFEPTSVSLSKEERALQLPILSGVPLSSVMVRETYVPASPPRRWVVHIQDVHAQYEAQKNIASAIDVLSVTHETPRLLVGLEGAQGAFFLDAFRTFPDKETLVDVSDAFLKKNILTGAEYAALVAAHGVDLWGVEDRALYGRHVKSVVDAVALEENFKKILADQSSRIRALKEKEYPADLKAWDKAYETYHSEKSSLGDYVRHIAAGERRGAFPQVEKFLEALETEQKLDFAQAERERKWLVEVLAARLSPTDLAALTQRALAFRAGRVGVGAFHEELISLAGKVGVTSKGFQEFLKYLNYVKRVEEIDRNDLLNEIDGQEKAHVARLLKSASFRVREIQAVSRDLVMADKLLRHALTPSEWAEYKKNSANFRSLPDRLAQLETGRPAAAGGFAEMVRVLEEFYRAASDRDRVLVDNLFARMGEGSVDKPAVAVLVAGGFHSDGVTALIKQRGAAYVTLTPRFEAVDGRDALDVFRQTKTPLDRLFAGEKLNLVEGLGGAAAFLGRTGRGAEVQGKFPAALSVSSSAEPESITAWLEGQKKDLPGFTFESLKWDNKTGFLVTFPDGRQLFAWQSESRDPQAGEVLALTRGVVNFAPHTPSFSKKVSGFFRNNWKQFSFGSVLAALSSLVQAADDSGLLAYLDWTGFSAILLVVISLLAGHLWTNREVKEKSRPNVRRVYFQLWLEGLNPLLLIKSMTLKNIKALILAVVVSVGTVSPTIAAINTPSAPLVAKQTQEMPSVEKIQTLDEIIAEAVKGSAVRLVSPDSAPAKAVGTLQFKVEKGMTLGTIYQQLKKAGTVFPGVSSAAEFIAAVAKLNGLNSSHFIKAGQILELPVVGPVSVAYQVPVVGGEQTVSTTQSRFTEPVVVTAAEEPALAGRDVGEAEGVRIDNFDDVLRITQSSLVAKRDAARAEAARLMAKAEHPAVKAVPGVEIGARADKTGTGVSAELASRLSTDDYATYVQAQRWADYSEAQLAAMALDQAYKAHQALLDYRTAQEARKIKETTARALHQIAKKGPSEAKAALAQAEKAERDIAKAHAKTEKEFARAAKEELGLGVNDSIQIGGNIVTASGESNLNVYGARIAANQAKIKALSQSLGTEGADEMAVFFRELLGIRLSASVFQEAGSAPLPQLGVSIDVKALNAAHARGKQYAERVSMALELLELKAANQQLAVESAQAINQATQQMGAARTSLKSARQALKDAERFLADQRAAYTLYGGTAQETVALVEAVRLRDEALTRLLASQYTEAQARAQYRFAGGVGDLSSVSRANEPMSAKELARVDPSLLFERAVKNRLGFSEEDIDKAVSPEDFESLAGRVPVNFRLNANIYRGGNPVGFSLSVLLWDSNRELREEQGKAARNRAEILVRAAANQVVRETSDAWLVFHDAQEAHQLAQEAYALQKKMTPETPEAPDYFAAQARLSMAQARLADAQQKEIAAWRAFQQAAGITPAEAYSTLGKMQGQDSRDPTFVVQVAAEHYDPSADKSAAAVINERIAELGYQMATNESQWWDLSVGVAVTPNGVFPYVMSARLADLLTAPFRWIIGAPSLDDYILASTALAQGVLEQAGAERAYAQGQKKADAKNAAAQLKETAERVKRTENRLVQARQSLEEGRGQFAQKRVSSRHMLDLEIAVVRTEAAYQAALGDYRYALNGVHQLGLTPDPEIAALEASDLPEPTPSAVPVTPETLAADRAVREGSVEEALAYLGRTQRGSTDPKALLKLTTQGGGGMAGLIGRITKAQAEKRAVAAHAKAQGEYVAAAKSYELMKEVAALAQRNEQVARAYWLNVIRPHVEEFFPGNVPDIAEGRNFAVQMAQVLDEMGKRLESARGEVGRFYGAIPAEAGSTAPPRFDGAPPTIQWVGVDAINVESHPAVQGAALAADVARAKDKGDTVQRHYSAVSFNVESPEQGGPQLVLRVTANVSPTLAGAAKSAGFEKEAEAAAFDKKEKVRRLEHEMAGLAQKINDGAEQLADLSGSLQSAQSAFVAGYAAYERSGVSLSGHVQQQAGLALPQQAAREYSAALDRYVNVRSEFEQSVARFNGLMRSLGLNPSDVLVVSSGADASAGPIALPPPARSTDRVAIPFHGELPGSMSRPGFTFEQRFNTALPANHPLADRPTHYVEVNLTTGKPTGRVIEAHYTTHPTDPSRRTTAFVDRRPYAAGDIQGTVPPSVSVFSWATLRSNPYNPYTLSDATVGWDRDYGWTIQSVAEDRAGNVVIDVAIPGGKRIRDEVIRDGKGARLKNQGSAGFLTWESVVVDNAGKKAIRKATSLDGRLIWEGTFTERQEPVSFVDHRNKIRGSVVERNQLPRATRVNLPGSEWAVLAYGGSVVRYAAVDGQGKPITIIEVLSDNFTSLGSVSNGTALRRTLARQDEPGQPAPSMSYTRFGDRDAGELRQGVGTVERKGSAVTLSLPDAGPYARLAYRGESVFVLPTNDGGTPGLAYVSPRGSDKASEVREGVKVDGKKVVNPGVTTESMTYGAPLPSGFTPVETRRAAGASLSTESRLPAPPKDLAELAKEGPSKAKAGSFAESTKERLPEKKASWWRKILEKMVTFFSGSKDAGAADFVDVRATPKGLLDANNQLIRLNGVNWRGIEYGWNFGDPRSGFAKDKVWMEGELDKMKASGVNAVRIPLLDDGRHLKADFSNFGQFRQDIQVFLDAAAARGIHVEFVLFDFLAVARGHFDMSKTATDNFRKNFLTPFLVEFGGHPALLTIDLINEPEWILAQSVPGGWGDKMEGGRKPVNAESYRYFVQQTAAAIKDPKLKGSDGKLVAGRVLVTIGASVKHHEIATQPGVSGNLDYYSWHHYDWMGSLSGWLQKIPSSGKPFELGEYATAGTPTSPAGNMGAVRSVEGGIGAYAWNWGDKRRQNIDEHTTADGARLRVDLKRAGDVARDPKSAPAQGTAVQPTETGKQPAEKQQKSGRPSAVAKPGIELSYRAADGTVYTPLPDGTVIRSIGDPFDPANANKQRVISVPEGFNFGAPGAMAYLDNPANAARTMVPSPRQPNGIKVIAVHGGAKARPDNLLYSLLQDRQGNTYALQPDGTYTVTPRGAQAPSVVVNPGEGFRPDGPDAEARLTASKNRVGFYIYAPVDQVVEEGRYSIPAPAGTSARQYYALDSSGEQLDSERPMEVRGHVFSEVAQADMSEPSILLARAIRPNLTVTAVKEMGWDLSGLVDPMLYQKERYGLTYESGSVELSLAQKIAVTAKYSYGLLLVERVQLAQEPQFRQRHGLGPTDSIPIPLQPLQREEAERYVDGLLLTNAVNLVPSVLARSIGMADKVNASDVQEAVAAIRDGQQGRSVDDLAARFTFSGSRDTNPVILNAMESLIRTLSGTMDFRESSQVAQILYHLNTVPFVGTDVNGRPAVRPVALDGDQLVAVIRQAEMYGIQLKDAFLARYPGREKATAFFSSKGLGVLLYWAATDVLTPVPLTRKEDELKTNPVGPPRVMIEKSGAIDRANRENFSFFLSALENRLFIKFLERWYGDTPSYADYIAAATMLTHQMAKNQSVLTPEIMQDVLSRLANGDASTVEEEVDALKATKDDVRASRAEEAFSDAAKIILWILVPLGLGAAFKRYYRRRGKEFWQTQTQGQDATPPAVTATPEPAVGTPPSTPVPVALPEPDLGPSLTDLAANLADVGGGLAGDFRKGHQALEEGRFFMKSTAGLRVTISSWRLSNFLSMGAGILIFLGQAYAVSTFGTWGGFSNVVWGIGAVLFLNGLLGNFLSWKIVALGGLILLVIYGMSSGAFASSSLGGILVGGVISPKLTQKLKLSLRSPNLETDWIGARILGNWLQSHFPRLPLWGWTDWTDIKVDPNAPWSKKIAFDWVQEKLGIRFVRLAPRAERQEKMVTTLIASMEKAQEKMDLLWVDLAPSDLKEDWKRQVLTKFAAAQGKIPAVKEGAEGLESRVRKAFSEAFPRVEFPSGKNGWIAAYGLLPKGKKTGLVHGLEKDYGGVVDAHKDQGFLGITKFLGDIPTSWLGAFSKLNDADRKELIHRLDSEVSRQQIDRDALQAKVRNLSRVWAAPPLGLPDDYVYVESLKVDFFEWIAHSKDWLEFLKGKADTYQIFSRTHYPNYDPQYHDPIFYVRGPEFQVLRRTGGNIYLMPGSQKDHDGYTPVTDEDRFSFNGPDRYYPNLFLPMFIGVTVSVLGVWLGSVMVAGMGAVFFVIPSILNWGRGGWPAVTHPAPLYNIAYYSQMVADRTRTTRDYMAGTVYPINEYRRAVLPYRGIVQSQYPNENLASLSDEEFFPRVWEITHGQPIGTLRVYPTLQAFLDDNLGQTVRDQVRQAQTEAVDHARMGFQEAMTEEETDRNNMVNPAIAAHKGLQGPGPTNSSQGNTLRQNILMLVLTAVAFFVLVPIVLSLRLDIGAAIEEGVQLVSTGLFSGVPVVGDALLAFTNIVSQFVTLENVEFLVFNATGISLFGGITFGMGAFALLMVGMVFKIILFFQGFKSPNRIKDILFGVGLLGVAGVLWFWTPFGWSLVVGSLLFGFIGAGWLLKAALATRYKEELTNQHVERFVPEHLMQEALGTVTDSELAAISVTRDQFNGWIREYGALGAWRRLAEREDSFLVLVRSALMGIPNTQRPIHRLRQDDQFNLLKIVYLANVQGPRRRELISHLLRLYDNPERRSALDGRMGGESNSNQWLNGLREEMESIDNQIAELGENHRPEEVLDVYFRRAREKRVGDFSNSDIIDNLSFEDIVHLKDNKDVHESLWPKIILMQTAFGGTSEERLFALLESAETLWPSIQVDITLDDNDEAGRNGILKSMKEGRLARFADRIIISNHAAHGTNLGIGNIHQRHKPMMNAEAVFRLNYRMKKFLGRLPFFQTLVDMEDVFLKEVIDDKMAIWAMRERTLNDQLLRQEQEEEFVSPLPRQRRWGRTAGLVMLVVGFGMALGGFGPAFAGVGGTLSALTSVLTTGQWIGTGGLGVAFAGWAVFRRSADRPSVDSQQWGIRLDSDALRHEYTKTVQGLATAAGLGRRWASNNVGDLRGAIEVNPPLLGTFNSLQDAVVRERDLRASGDIEGAERVRVEAVRLAESLNGEQRALYELWAYAQVFPTLKDFRRQVFRIRNMPDVIQTELRQIPLNAADRRFSELSHIDYLFWHNTIQIGEDASGFMFLGGTGNTFMWELLGGTDDHAYVRLSRMVWPLREANRKEETERPLFLRLLLLVPLPMAVLSILVPRSLRASFAQARATWISSRTLYKHLNRYVPTGVWDKFNIIEDSERGRRSAFLGLTSHRLYGRDKEVLEDPLPRLGPKWLNQRQRWIIQQTFFAIIRFLPVGLMFYVQYLGAGLGFALIGDRGNVLQGLLLGMGGGFVIGGVVAYLVGLVLFRWLGRAGIIRNTQFYVNPLVGLSLDRGPGLWRAIVSRVKAYYKFQQIAHLAASVPMMMASSVLVTITLLYFLGFFFNIGTVMEFVEGFGIPGLTGFVSLMVIFIQTFFPIIEAVVPTTFWGILIFLYPPIAMNLMALVTVMYTSWRDDESVRAAVQTKFTSRVHSFLFLFVSTGMADDDPFDLPGTPIVRDEDKILAKLREVEEKGGEFAPKFRGLNRQILEGFLMTAPGKESNLARLNSIIAELQSIARDLMSSPDNALNPNLLGDHMQGDLEVSGYAKRTRNVIENQVRPLLADMGLSEVNQRQIMDKLLQDQTELEDLALGRLRYGWRTFYGGVLAIVAASALVLFGWDYPMWLGAFLVALGVSLLVISTINLIWKIPAFKGSVQMRNFAVQSGRALKMYFYFTFLHPSAWRNFGVAVNSFYKPGANEPFWTRGRDEGLGDLSLWELTPRRRFEIWWAGTGKTILQYSVFPFIILASLPWLTAVHDWRTKIEREVGVEQVKVSIVTKEGVPSELNWTSWARALGSAYQLNPESFHGWVVAQIEEASRLYQESKDRDSVMERRALRQLDMSLLAVRTYADGLARRTNWDNPIEVEKAVRRYEEVIQAVQRALAVTGQTDRFEKIFPSLPLKPVPILNQFQTSGQQTFNRRDVVIDAKYATAGRPRSRTGMVEPGVVELRIPQSDLRGHVVGVASQLWPTPETRKVEVRVDQVSYPKDGDLKSPEKERKAQGASAVRLPTGRDVVQTFVFHSYSPNVLAPNYTAQKVNKVEIVAYTRGAEPFEARMRFDQVVTRRLADPRIDAPVLTVPRAPTVPQIPEIFDSWNKFRYDQILNPSTGNTTVGPRMFRSPITPNTIEWLWTAWNRMRGRDVSTDSMIVNQAPWESYWMLALAGLAVPFLIFLQWSPVLGAGVGVVWGLLHLGGTFDKDLKPISGFKALVPAIGKAVVAGVAVVLFALGLDSLLALSPLSEFLARLALFDGWASVAQISLLSNLLVVLPVSLFLAGPLFKSVHQLLNKGAVAAAQQRRAVPISEMGAAIEALNAQSVDTSSMGRFLSAVLSQMPLQSLDVSSRVDPLVLRNRLAQEVPTAFESAGSNVDGLVGEAGMPAVHLGRMLAPGVKGEAFSAAVRDYAFALGYQMARSDNPGTLVPLLEAAYLTVASRSQEVGVHMSPTGFAQAFQLGAAFAQTVSVQDNEAAVFHVDQSVLSGEESEVLDKLVETILANARKENAGVRSSPIELVSSDSAVVSADQVRAAVMAYVQKYHPGSMDPVSQSAYNVRLRSSLNFKEGKIDSVALFDQIKLSAGHVTGMACFTSQPDAWTVNDVIRLVPLEKVLADVLQKLEALKATESNA